MTNKTGSTSKNIGVVGLGLMGTSIAANLVLEGEFVIGVAPIPAAIDLGAPKRIKQIFKQCIKHKKTTKSLDELLAKIKFVSDYQELKSCGIVLECVYENTEIKKSVYTKIEQAVTEDTIITTNTSAIPISELQKYINKPNRFFGMHWAEPAYTSKFLEIICGIQSNVAIGEMLYARAENWGKEPILVRKDIRGFITNRIMYAMYREAFSLVENGYATIQDVDRACKNDAGYWMTFCGLFRYMDITGVKAYHAVMGDLFPDLSVTDKIPVSITKIVEQGGNGISNGKGFYNYAEEESEHWERLFEQFSFDVNELSNKYKTEQERIVTKFQKNE